LSVVVTLEDVRAVALSLPGTYERVVGDRFKFKVGVVVYATVSPDESMMGFGFPKEERAGLIAAEPEKFFMPRRSVERYNWVRVWLEKLDHQEMRELVTDAWRMCVSKKKREAFDALHPPTS
jgi:hypothetical protein